MIYLDHAATTPMLPEVIESINAVANTAWGNPSSSHSNGRKAKTILEKARRTFAADLGVTPGEIVFTSGATESIYLGMRAACAEGVTHIVTAATEHKAVLDASKDLSAQYKIPLTILPVDTNGDISLHAMETILAKADGRVLISLMFVNNETGCVHPVKEIGAIAAKYDAVFFCDCVQAPLYYDLAPVENGIHYLSLSAHKLYGPKGVGMLYVRKDREKHALWKGGMQERAWRPGTENVMGIAGFATAWEHALQNREVHSKDVLSIRSAAVDALHDIPGIQFTGKNTAPHILHFSFPSALSTETILLQLDMKGIALSAGSACQSGSHRASHVVEALGKSPGDVHLRMSFGFMNQREDVVETCKALLI